MSQISPPIRILLVGAVVLAAAWVLVLKPKDDTASPAAVSTPVSTPLAKDPNGPAAKTSLGRAVQKAEGASQASDATNNAVQAASGEAPTTDSTPATAGVAPATAPSTAATTAPQTATKPATTAADPDLADLPAWLQSSIDKKVVAILFWNKNATDDRRTHNALQHAFTDGGKVVTHTVPIEKIADYGDVARGVDVSQSPTLMIIDRDRNASSLVGYNNLDAINQAIIDGLLATDDPSEKVAAARVMDVACDSFQSAQTVSTGDATPSKDYKAQLAGVSGGLHKTLALLPPMQAAGPYKGQLKLLRAYVHSEQGVVTKIKATALKHKLVDGVAIRKAEGSNDKLEARAALHLSAIGVDGCS